MKTALLFLALACQGCATGVVMDEAEQAACRAQGSAWTADEIRALVTRAFRAGHERGYRDGTGAL